ncbi:hypothetical protein [Bacillus infantis]|uniref:2TM domain-containing protein n=1 Tax=Bacillus infantis TaxID=324767 RepID=A0A5D4R8W5_9BACI|nr:hypothetical protein [Bacillus infantis]TYS47777.1 hypothetical protein FZD51_12645 [Bacillus infantis]
MNWILWFIILCEVGFWVLILAGLCMRYLFGKKKTGLILLAMTPAVDLLLLAAAGADLYRGSEATQAHALAAVYIGVSIAFGKSMIQWADERFLYYIAKKGKRPEKRYGMNHASHNLKGLARHGAAYIIGAALLMGTVLIIDDPGRTEALSGAVKIWSIVLAADLVYCISYFIWPKAPKKSKEMNI